MHCRTSAAMQTMMRLRGNGNMDVTFKNKCKKTFAEKSLMVRYNSSGF